MNTDETQKKFVCEQCGNKHDGSYGSGRFCSESCKQKFVNQSSAKKHICKFCGKEFPKAYQLGSHVRLCQKNPNQKQTLQKSINTQKKNFENRNPLEHHKLKCLNCGNDYKLDIRHDQFQKGDYSHFCSKHCSKSYAATVHAEEAYKKFPKTLKTKTHIIKCAQCGKDILRKICVSISLCDDCKKKKSVNPTSKCLICGKLTKRNNKGCCKEHSLMIRVQEFRKTAKLNKRCGGLRQHGGHGKHGKYKGYQCDSSWELAYVIWNIEHNVKFSRNTKGFPYEYNGEKHKYYPDFQLDDKTYVEIKGYFTEVVNAKHLAFRNLGYELIVIDREKIEKYLEYAKLKYGNDFTLLYET